MERRIMIRDGELPVGTYWTSRQTKGILLLNQN